MIIDGATLEEVYGRLCREDSDIFQHLPTLRRLAEQCEHVTEFGVRFGVSTFALLAAQPTRLISYDRAPFPSESTAVRLRGCTSFSFILADTLQVDIEPTDMLFIDTLHTHAQLSGELRRHADKVRRFIVLHDTTTFGDAGEDGGPGLWPAVLAFVAVSSASPFRIVKRYENNNGLTVLERV